MASDSNRDTKEEAKTDARKKVYVACKKCNREGSLVIKQTKSKGITYKYYYIEHHIGKKIKWCYLGKLQDLPEDYQKLIHKRDTQKEQEDAQTKEQDSMAKDHSLGMRSSSSWLGHKPSKLAIPGSNPGDRTRENTQGICYIRLFSKACWQFRCALEEHSHFLARWGGIPLCRVERPTR
jgi:hypothetical protein